MSTQGDGGPGGFLSQQRPEGRSWLPWVAAGAVVLVLLGLVLAAGHRGTPAQQAMGNPDTPDAYASQITFDRLDMSEATNFAGGKVTYIDGTVENKGAKTVTGVTVAVTFQCDGGQPPETSSMPLRLIRTREPYVDIEPVSSAPLGPGGSHEFRLIFDHVPAAWNQQHPTIQAVHVQTR